MFQQLTMVQFLQQGGLVMLLLGLCSILSIAVIIERWMAYSSILGKCKKYEQAMMTLLPKKKIAEATSLCKKSPSMLSNLYLAVLTNKGKSTQFIEEAVQRQVLRILMVLERRLNFLATLGSTTPFIGLFGTVFGIIKTFRGMSFGQSYSPSLVTNGIAEALLNTAAGLFVAIPAVMAYNYYSHRIQIFLRETEILTSEMIEQVAKEAGHSYARQIHPETDV